MCVRPMQTLCMRVLAPCWASAQHVTDVARLPHLFWKIRCSTCEGMRLHRPGALGAGAARTGRRAPAEVAEVQAQDVGQAAHTLQGKCPCQCNCQQCRACQAARTVSACND